jgi:hypothetical protein
MTAIKDQKIAVEKLCRAAIEENLGAVSGLPEELVDCVFNVYREFVGSYLNILRQKENRPDDWLPATLRIDPELTDEMRHFFSDYQHITKKFYWLNQQMDRLQAMDRDTHLKLYQHRIDEILKQFEPQA